jgi:Amt family ammonium transporter
MLIRYNGGEWGNSEKSVCADDVETKAIMNVIPTVALILAGAMALLIRAGSAIHTAGLVRSKNAASAVMRSIVDMAIAALAYWVIGGAIMSGVGGGAIGFNKYLLFLIRGDEAFLNVELFFNLVLVLIATMPIAAALSERSRFGPIGFATALTAAVIVPICGYWAWIGTGWLSRLGFIDNAGASVVHLTGGLVAAVGAIMIGARGGKYNTDGSTNFIPGHSTSWAAGGLLMMAAAWVPYVVGACLLHRLSHMRVATNVILAASASVVVSYGMSRSRYGKADVHLTLGGLLAGLVSICAGAGVVNPVAAVAIGAVGGWLVMWATVHMDMTLKVDDPSGTIVAHVVGGAWGTIAVGIFAVQESWGQRLRLIGIQSLGVVAMGALALGLGFALFAILRLIMPLRVSEADEYDGLDLAEHDLNAYPDFQQTMIKSYHLREA